MMRSLVFGLLAAIVLVAPAFADGEGKPPHPPKVEHTPATFFATEKTCKAATDGCQTCKRTETSVSCSTPGFACVPKDWTCTEKGG